MSDEHQVGDLVGGYVLERRLGGGGFGSVWRARAERDGRIVAVKLLTGKFAGGDAARLRGDVEVMAGTASRRSRHVVRVLGGGPDPVPHIVMEYIEGSDLARELDRRGTLTQREALRVAAGVADALSHLEEAGIIHRDVKPANVMLDADSVVKLTDFGIAKIVGYDTSSLVFGGEIPLSMAFAAPEVWEGHASHQSDLYALGALLFQCLAGRPLFLGGYAELFHQHTHTPPDLSKLPADTVPSLRQLITQCLAKDPDDRPAHARDLAGIIAAGQIEFADSEEGDAFTVMEPRSLGPWKIESRVAEEPWTFRCRHDQTGEAALVEVHFTDDLNYGGLLRQAVSANPSLHAAGAERIIGRNRLILRPGEVWLDAPASQFQFWVAREPTQQSPAPTTTSRKALASIVKRVVDLLRVAREEHVLLTISGETLSVAADGHILLRRPGLPPLPTDDPQNAALAWIRKLPLDPEAAALAEDAANLAELQEALRDPLPSPEPETVVEATLRAIPVPAPEPVEDERPTLREIAVDRPTVRSESTVPDEVRLNPQTSGRGGGGGRRLRRRWLFGGGAFVLACAGAGVLAGRILWPTDDDCPPSCPPTPVASVTLTATQTPSATATVFAAPTLPSPNRVLGQPIPALITVDAPVTVAVGGLITIRVHTLNVGDVDAKLGSVTVSLPWKIDDGGISPSSDAGKVEVHPALFGAAYLRDGCNVEGSNRDVAHTFVELNVTGWEKGVDHILSFTVAAERAGLLEFRIRATMVLDSCFHNAPADPQKDVLDQQNFPAIVRVVEVQ